MYSQNIFKGGYLTWEIFLEILAVTTMTKYYGFWFYFYYFSGMAVDVIITQIVDVTILLEITILTLAVAVLNIWK